MKKLSEVLTLSGDEITQRPELKLLRTPLCEFTPEQRKSTEWCSELGTVDEYMELWRQLGSKPTMEQQMQAFNIRLERARRFLNSLPSHKCPGCGTETPFKNGCGCID